MARYSADWQMMLTHIILSKSGIHSQTDQRAESLELDLLTSFWFLGLSFLFTEETWLHSREIGKLPLSIDILSQQYIIECMAVEDGMKDLFTNRIIICYHWIIQRHVSVFHAQYAISSGSALIKNETPSLDRIQTFPQSVSLLYSYWNMRCCIVINGF